MRLTIDNADGRGALDYTDALDAKRAPLVKRKLNRPSHLTMALVASTPEFAVPAARARVVLERRDGGKLFTGYVIAVPDYEYLGWGERGPVYRYIVNASSDEFLLDTRILPKRAPFVHCTAGDILKQLAVDLLPGAFDMAGVEPGATLPSYTGSVAQKWSEHAAQIALLTRGAYRVHDGTLSFGGVGKQSYVLDEAAADFCPEGLTLHSPGAVINDVTVIGRLEPGTYVKDYFLGDGMTLAYYLADRPFARRTVVVDEEYAGTGLNPRYWVASDPAHVVAVSGGKLTVSGGNNADGATTVTFVEPVELGGSPMLQHGEVEFTAASSGILGGLYNGPIDAAHCVAGFRVSPSGAQSVISALINGAAAGVSITTQTGHRYVLTTRAFTTQAFRAQQSFHSSQHQAGDGRGGTMLGSDVHIILELHDIDLYNAGSQAAAAVVLFDGTITSAPAYCTYALVNSTNLRTNIAFTRIISGIEAEVATTIPGQQPRNRLLGSLSEGAHCHITSGGNLQFYPQYAPAPNEAIRLSYRVGRRAIARITDPASIASLARGGDDGVRAAVRAVVLPAPRTGAECADAARALLDDSTGAAWSGEYRTWSDFLPQHAEDIHPGDALAVVAPSRDADFQSIVRDVEIELCDLANDRSRYKLRFANDAAEPLAFDLDPAHLREPFEPIETTVDVTSEYIDDLPAAEITAATSTTVTMNAGTTPPAGGGIEVRRSDSGWGADSDRNLVGRFNTQTFTAARLSNSQTYYLRQYDAGAPARYSRYSTALHIDYPL